MAHVPSFFVALMATLLWSTPIFAERVYRYLDEEGGVTYTNYPLQYCQKKMKGIEVLNVRVPLSASDDASLEYAAHGEFDCERFMLEHESFFECGTEDECKKAFALAQIFVSHNSESKIRIATDSIVETYSPTRNGTVGLKILKIPGRANSAKIVIKVSCKSDYKEQEPICQERQTSLYRRFPRFMTESMQ